MLLQLISFSRQAEWLLKHHKTLEEGSSLTLVLIVLRNVWLSILGRRSVFPIFPTNDGRRYTVTLSFIRWAHTQNDPRQCSFNTQTVCYLVRTFQLPVSRFIIRYFWNRNRISGSGRVICGPTSFGCFPVHQLDVCFAFNWYRSILNRLITCTDSWLPCVAVLKNHCMDK